MIEVVQDQFGDRATAEDAESAVVAARTLCADIHHATGVGMLLTCSFWLDGKPLRLEVPENDLWAVGVIA